MKKVKKTENIDEAIKLLKAKTERKKDIIECTIIDNLQNLGQYTNPLFDSIFKPELVSSSQYEYFLKKWELESNTLEYLVPEEALSYWFKIGYRNNKAKFIIDKNIALNISDILEDYKIKSPKVINQILFVMKLAYNFLIDNKVKELNTRQLNTILQDLGGIEKVAYNWDKTRFQSANFKANKSINSFTIKSPFLIEYILNSLMQIVIQDDYIDNLIEDSFYYKEKGFNTIVDEYKERVFITILKIILDSGDGGILIKKEKERISFTNKIIRLVSEIIKTCIIFRDSNIKKLNSKSAKNSNSNINKWQLKIKRYLIDKPFIEKYILNKKDSVRYDFIDSGNDFRMELENRIKDLF